MTVAVLRRFASDRKGNVAILFALTLVPIIFLTGMGIDYTVANQRRRCSTRLPTRPLSPVSRRP